MFYALNAGVFGNVALFLSRSVKFQLDADNHWTDHQFQEEKVQGCQDQEVFYELQMFKNEINKLVIVSTDGGRCGRESES